MKDLKQIFQSTNAVFLKSSKKNYFAVFYKVINSYAEFELKKRQCYPQCNLKNCIKKMHWKEVYWGIQVQ